MSEAAGVLAPHPRGGEATRLIALLEAGQFQQADNLTAEMAAETAEWRDLPDCKWTGAQFTEKVKRWWLGAYGRILSEEDAEDAERIWTAAAARKKEALAEKAERARAAEQTKRETDFAAVLGTAVAKVEAQPTAIAKTETAKAVPKAAPWPEAPIAPPGAGADQLTYPRGLLGHVVQYMVDTSPLPNRWLSLAAALCVLAKGLDRKVIGPSGSSTVLYILLMAETGAGKQQAIQSIRMVLKAMGLENAIVASGLASVQAIEEIVEETPSALILIDEIGAWLNRISAKGQTGNVAEIPGSLQSLWAWSPELNWNGTKRKGKEMVSVFGPALSIFGDSTEAKLIKGLTKEEISNGFLNRWLLFGIGRGAPKRVEPKYPWTKLPVSLRDHLKQVVGEPASFIGVEEFRRIGWGEGAKELWLEFEEYTRGMPSEKDRELWIRAPEQAVRVATIHAVYRGSAVVGVEDWKWAVEVVEYSMHQLVRSLNEHEREKLEQVDLVERIRKEFLRHEKLPDGRKPGELTEGQIHKLCERLCEDYRKIDLAVKHLLTTGEIEEFVPTRRGPKTRHFRWKD